MKCEFCRLKGGAARRAVKTGVRPLDRNRLIIALDVNEPARAVELVDMLKPYAGMFKVGMELFYSSGRKIIDQIKQRDCGVFLDLKLHDIPNTVARAARVLTQMGPDMFNVHASGGPEMMKAAAEAVDREAGRLGLKKPLLVAVTVLTSIDRDTLNKAIGIMGDIEQYVTEWAKMAKNCGLDGVVASPREVSPVRQACGEGFITVTPGVRPHWSVAGDQKRVMTPAEAVAAGATYIVVGRPVTEAPDPAAAARKILGEIKGCAG